jgi:hypothetical protein
MEREADADDHHRLRGRHQVAAADVIVNGKSNSKTPQSFGKSVRTGAICPDYRLVLIRRLGRTHTDISCTFEAPSADPGGASMGLTTDVWQADGCAGAEIRKRPGVRQGSLAVSRSPEYAERTFGTRGVHFPIARALQVDDLGPIDGPVEDDVGRRLIGEDLGRHWEGRLESD